MLLSLSLFLLSCSTEFLLLFSCPAPYTELECMDMRRQNRKESYDKKSCKILYELESCINHSSDSVRSFEKCVFSFEEDIRSVNRSYPVHKDSDLVELEQSSAFMDYDITSLHDSHPTFCQDLNCKKRTFRYLVIEHTKECK